jgi:hypothetical protein
MESDWTSVQPNCSDARKGFGPQAFTGSFGGRNWGGGARPRRASSGRIAVDALSDGAIAAEDGSVEIQSEQPLVMPQLAPSCGRESSGQQGAPVASALTDTVSCQSVAAVVAWA